MKGPTRRVTPEDITAELVEKAAAGMPAPAGVLADFIYGWVDAVLKGSPDVDDATQEAFLAVLHAVRNDNFERASGKPSNWVVKIAVRKAIDIHRNNRRQLTRFDSGKSVDEIPPSSRRDISSIIDAEDAINTLNEEERALLLLRYYEAFSIEEISEMLSIPDGTVKSRTFRAYTKLRSLVHPRELPAQILNASRGKA